LVDDIGRFKDEGRYSERNISSVLDIGAGNGKVLEAIQTRCEFTGLYAIEKSMVLCQQLDPKVFIVGTDFLEQSLVAKQVDVTFCNPPYSAFVEWSKKIISVTFYQMAV